jgi:putative ABC transport system permease protein
MLKNLFKTAVRNILKHFGYSILNILGLTIGISSALFLIIYVTDEVSYDRYHEKADRIYRVSSKITERDDQFTWNVAQIPFGPQVVQDYPEVQSFVRFFPIPRAVYKYEDKEFNEENFCYADSTLFDIFTYRVIKGDVRRALLEPNKIVLTERIAAKYFGKSDPIGKTLTSGINTYEVTGVIKDVPRNSHFRFDALAARKNLPKQSDYWTNFGVFTYLLFRDNFDIKPFESKIKEMYGRYMSVFAPLNIHVEYILEPITRIHLYSTNAGEPEPTGSITYVYIFAIVAIFLVLIAAMNYMNLATARSAGRAREVGMRKVAGSQRGPLILQFLSESVIFTLISLILSLAVLIILLPKFNLLAGKFYDLHVIYSPVVLMSLFGVILLVGILGGCYPAFFLSRFSPLTVLKGEITQGTAGSTFRKVLVVIQFTVSVVMIICTMVVFRQLNYLKGMDQGFDQKNIVTLELNGAMSSKYLVLKQLLLNNPGIKSVTATDTPVGEGSGKTLFNVETDQGMVQRGINFAVVDHDFIKTLGIMIKAGRNFQRDMPSDTIRGVIVNETFVKRMNWVEPIGKKVELLGDSSRLHGRVIGVMKDYHQTGMYNEIESLLLMYRITRNVVYIKVSDTDIKQAIKFIETKWKEVFPDQPFSYTFLSERFNRQFEADEKRGFIFTLFTILAILIACLGLFGLASYSVEQRTKEIGIRKVFGADSITILTLISRDFLILVTISIIIAFPVAYYFMSRWLENYVYRNTLGPLLFILSALLTILITFLTISFKAYQASVMNPANSIKTE